MSPRNRILFLALLSPLLGGAAGGSGAWRGFVENWAAGPAPLVVSLSAIALVVGSWLTERMRRRRVRGWAAMIARAADQLVETHEFTQINAGKNEEFGMIAHAFNRLSVIVSGQDKSAASPSETVDASLDCLDDLARAAAELAAITQKNDLRAAVSRLALSTFGGRRCDLWLLHNYLARPGRDAGDDHDVAEAQGASGPDTILRNLGLTGAETAYADPEDREIASSLVFPAAGVLEAATSRKTLLVDDVSDSVHFGSVGTTLAEHGFGSYLAIPLVMRERTIGVVEVYGENPLAPGEIKGLEVFSRVAASFIAEAWSLHESAHNREALEMKNLELAMANRKLERTNEQLASADRLKGEFLANTSHELRTPLNAILGFAKLLLNRRNLAAEEQQRYAQTIYDSGERLLALIDDVLDLSKIEAGRLDVELGPVQIQSSLDAVKSLLEVQAVQQGNTIRFEVPNVQLPLVRADGSRLYQVLVNIVSNANKFTEKGRITVRVHPESIPGFMRIEIVDTGVGISPEVQARLFQSFVQGDGSTTRRFGGTGLGLTISKKMLELMGGAVRLHSAGRDRGTTVTLDVPLWSDELEESAAETTARALDAGIAEGDDRPLAILVEDYLEFQKYLQELLADQGWNVKTARTAADGMKLIERFRPTAVLLDIHLPTHDDEASIHSGYDLIRAMGHNRDLTSVPIFVVTGMREEACDYLLSQTVLLPVEVYSKPLDEEMFLGSLARLRAAV